MVSNPVATDLRARKSTVVIMTLSAMYLFLETVCACEQTYYSSLRNSR